MTFNKMAFQVKAYELRTGILVVDTKVEIGGESCPPTISYTTYRNIDAGPSSQMSVTPGDADVRAAFAPVITP